MVWKLDFTCHSQASRHLQVSSGVASNVYMYLAWGEVREMCSLKQFLYWKACRYVDVKVWQMPGSLWRALPLSKMRCQRVDRRLILLLVCIDVNVSQVLFCLRIQGVSICKESVPHFLLRDLFATLLPCLVESGSESSAIYNFYFVNEFSASNVVFNGCITFIRIYPSSWRSRFFPTRVVGCKKMSSLAIKLHWIDVPVRMIFIWWTWFVLK